MTWILLLCGSVLGQAPIVSLESNPSSTQGAAFGDSLAGTAAAPSPAEPREEVVGQRVDLGGTEVNGAETTDVTTVNSHTDDLSVASALRRTWPDQKAIWLSPFRLRKSDITWLGPFGAVTGALIATDSAMMRQVSDSPTRISNSRSFGNYGTAALIGAGGGMYLWGVVSKDERRRSTGLLAGEALLDGVLASEALKLVTQRPRPLNDSGRGRFGEGGRSFPSEHAMAAWSVAAVISHQYPGPLTRMLSYGAASAISISRVRAREHFVSDVLVGSAVGFGIGRYLSRRNDTEEQGRGAFGTFKKVAAGGHQGAGDSARTSGMGGSIYVPLDSWTYPAFDRLAALGFAPSGFSNLRPWTRVECARLAEEAWQLVREQLSAPPQAVRLAKELRAEFADAKAEQGVNSPELTLDSIYTRSLTVAGPALSDGFHFAETLTNDSGRISREGENFVLGLSSHANAGPLAFYLRGEFQSAPSAAALPEGARQAIAAMDGIPAGTGDRVSSVSRFRPIEAYVAMNIKNWQFAFGKQALWWGPGAGGAMLFSTNAEPITMLRLDRVTPFMLPGPARWLGKIRVEAFWGVLDGYDYVRYRDGSNSVLVGRPVRPHPYIHGEKISFKPSPNFEFAVSETTIFSGPGYPLTGHTFLSSYGMSNSVPGEPNDPGDRRSAFDFRYRVPGLRNWLTFYLDSFTEDEISPIGYPRRSAMNPGIYLPKLPKIPKLDFRAEGVYTDLPGLRPRASYYWNAHYLSGYTNYRQILGNWVGRQGRGVQVWSTYWLSPQNKLQVGYRQLSVSRDFLEGGRVRDIHGTATFMLRPRAEMNVFVQHERWSFPLLANLPKSNLTASIRLNYRLKWGLH